MTMDVVRLPGFETEDEAIAWCLARGFVHPVLYRGVDGMVRGSVRVRATTDMKKREVA